MEKEKEYVCMLHSSEHCSDSGYSNRTCSLNEHATCQFRYEALHFNKSEKSIPQIEPEPFSVQAPEIIPEDIVKSTPKTDGDE